MFSGSILSASQVGFRAWDVAWWGHNFWGLMSDVGFSRRIMFLNSMQFFDYTFRILA